MLKGLLLSTVKASGEFNPLHTISRLRVSRNRRRWLSELQREGKLDEWRSYALLKFGIKDLTDCEMLEKNIKDSGKIVDLVLTAKLAGRGENGSFVSAAYGIGGAALLRLVNGAEKSPNAELAIAMLNRVKAEDETAIRVIEVLKAMGDVGKQRFYLHDERWSRTTGLTHHFCDLCRGAFDDPTNAVPRLLFYIHKPELREKTLGVLGPNLAEGAKLLFSQMQQ